MPSRASALFETTPPEFRLADAVICLTLSAARAWQSGAFKCRPRDRWVGWITRIRFQRLHLVANQTRLLLGNAGTFPELGSQALWRITWRLLRDEREARLTSKSLIACPAHCSGVETAPESGSGHSSRCCWRSLVGRLAARTRLRRREWRPLPGGRAPAPPGGLFDPGLDGGG